jgi:cell wall-associated NlpC family hydrolase
MRKTKYARDRWEYPRMPVVPARIRRRRFALTIALTATFFAGAALAAGAGIPLTRTADDSGTLATTTTVDTTAGVVTTTDVPPTTTTTADEATTMDAAPATTTDDAAPDSAPAATTDVATSTDTAPVATTDDGATLAPTPAPADALPTTTAQNPSEASTAPAVSVPTRAPAVHTTAVRKPKKKQTQTAAATKPAPVRTLDRPLAIPYHAIVFDPQQWLNDNPGTPIGQAAVGIAMNYLGVPYRWGGTVPETGFDCSGLVRFVYGQLGVSLVHYAASQFAAFPKLSPVQLQPGDLVFFEPKLDGPGHVGLYIGHDEMIEAPHTGAVVRIASVSGAAAQLGFMGAVRPYANLLYGGLTLLSVDSRPASLISKVPY